MKRRRRIMIALTLVIILVIAGSASLILWKHFGARAAQPQEAEETAELPAETVPSEVPVASPSAEPSEDPSAEPEGNSSAEPGSPNQTAPMGSPYFVSLYSVELINARPRAKEATSTEVKAETWEMWGVMDWHRNLTYLNTQLGDIPLLEAYKDDGKEKPLLLFLHGLGEDKETIIETLSAFAEAGYHAVGVDAFDQGDRLRSIPAWIPGPPCSSRWPTSIRS